MSRVKVSPLTIILYLPPKSVFAYDIYELLHFYIPNSNSSFLLPMTYKGSPLLVKPCLPTTSERSSVVLGVV